MKKSIVLIMHGMPPKDFPTEEKKEYMKLRSKYNDTVLNPEDKYSVRYHDLDLKMRKWPRNKDNDLFSVASNDLGRDLEVATNSTVFVGFNEFCSPSAEEALESAAQAGSDEIVVVTPMLTPGGNHSEEEIPALIKQAQANHPEKIFRYAWPFNSLEVARFLVRHMQRFEKQYADIMN